MYEANLSDREFQQKLIDSRNPDQLVIPLYVIVCNQKYSIMDLDSIKQYVSESQFKVGFGTSSSLISKPNNFPGGQLYNFNVSEAFTVTDDETKISTNYIIMEESLTPEDDDSTLTKIYSEIDNWIHLLYGKYISYINKRDSIPHVDINHANFDNEEDIYFE